MKREFARHIATPILLAASVFFASVLVSAQVVRVGFYENPPKLYTDEAGRISGFFPEILEYIAAEEDWEIEYVSGTWDENLERLLLGELDLLPDVAFSESRARSIAFSQETLFVNWGVVFVRSDMDVDTFPDLDGRTLAVMRGSIHTEGERGIKSLLDAFGVDASYVEVDDYEAAFRAVDKGQAEAAVVNRLFAERSKSLHNVSETPIYFNPRELRFAAPLGSEVGAHLLAQIDVHVRQMKSDPDSLYYSSVADLLRWDIAGAFRLPRWLVWALSVAGGGLVVSGVVILHLRHRQRLMSRTLEAAVERALRSEAEFRELVEQSPVAASIHSPEGWLIDANAAFWQVWAIDEADREKVMKKYNLLGDEQVRELGLMPLIEEAFGGKQVTLPPYQYDSRRTLRRCGIEAVSSDSRWIQGRLHPIKASCGRIKSVMLFEEDMTPRVEAEENLRRHRDELRLLHARLREAEEDERRRIARELHDKVSQDLTAVSLGINTAQSEIAATIGESSRALQSCQTLIDEVNAHIRDLTFRLRPPVLDDFGLKAALAWHAERAATQTGVDITIEGDEPDPRLPREAEIALFRIAQEALSNAMRHSGSEEIVVAIASEGSSVDLSISDDGCGFDTEADPQGRDVPGWGLLNMRERAEAIGATLDLRSAPGEGTRVTVSIPR